MQANNTPNHVNLSNNSEPQHQQGEQKRKKIIHNKITETATDHGEWKEILWKQKPHHSINI